MDRPYPEGVAWDEALRQREKAEQLQAEVARLEQQCSSLRKHIAWLENREPLEGE